MYKTEDKGRLFDFASEKEIQSEKSVMVRLESRARKKEMLTYQIRYSGLNREVKTYM